MSNKLNKLKAFSANAISLIPQAQSQPEIQEERNQESFQYLPQQQPSQEDEDQIQRQRIQRYERQRIYEQNQRRQRQRMQQEQDRKRERQLYEYEQYQRKQQYQRRKNEDQRRKRQSYEQQQRRRHMQQYEQNQRYIRQRDIQTQRKKQKEEDQIRLQRQKRIAALNQTGGKMSGNPDDSPPQSQQEPIQKLQYVKGDFSSFAHRTETQNIKLKRYIKKVINQAIQSHLAELQKVMKVQKELEKTSKQLIDKYKAQFKLPQLMIQFMKDPIGTQLEQIQSSNKSLEKLTLQTRLQRFLMKVIEMRQYAIVQGKIADKRSFKLNQYMQDEAKNIFLPSKIHQNYFLKINASSQTMQYAILSQTKLMSREQFGNLNRQERQTIVSMIYKFLQEKKIIVAKSEIIQHIQSRIQEMKRN